MRRLALSLVLLGCGASAPAATEPAATEPAAAERAATEPTAADDGLSCEPVNYACGCTWECALVREDGAVWVRLDSEGEQQFTREPAFEVCDATGCRAALVMANATCTGACAPSRAPMTGCHRVAGEATDATGTPCVPDP